MNNSKNTCLIIYDIEEKDEGILSGAGDNVFLFSASPMVKSCIGCFGCWIKTPGSCVIKDRCSVIPGYLSKSNEMLIITPIQYGGYSPKVKAVLDRSIGYLLPYFRIIDKEMHHKMRYDNPFKLNLYFYGKSDSEEQAIAEKLVKANAINLGAGSSEIHFYDSVEAIGKEMKWT